MRVHEFIVASVTLFMGSGCLSINDPTSTNGVTQMRPDERGFVAGLGIESQDLVVVAEKMARGMLGVAPIAQAKGKPNIVLEPVVNKTRFNIDKEIFLTRIRVALNDKAQGRVNFLARQRIDALERERNLKQGGQVTGGGSAQANEFKGADFILTGTLESISSRGKAGASDYILYTFQLLDPRTSDIVWESFYEIKKQGRDDVTYQ